MKNEDTKLFELSKQPFNIFDQIIEGMKHTIETNSFVNTDVPCEKLDFCPYGYLIEMFHSIPESFEINDSEKLCPKFGHICLVFFFAEKLRREL